MGNLPPLCPHTVEECAQGCERLAKLKSAVGAAALRQAARDMRAALKQVQEQTNADGGEVVVCEFGVDPGVDAGVQRVMWG